MTTNRRAFLTAAFAGATAIALRPKVAEAGALDAGSLQGLAGVAPIAPPKGQAFCGMSAAEAVLQVVAEELKRGLLDNLDLARMVKRSFEPTLCADHPHARFFRRGDSVVVRGSDERTYATVELAHHLIAEFQIADIDASLRNPKVLMDDTWPTAIRICEGIDRALWEKHTSEGWNLADRGVLVTRSLPNALPGLGVLQRNIEADGIAARVTMSYCPSSLAQRFTLDVLFGVGVMKLEPWSSSRGPARIYLHQTSINAMDSQSLKAIGEAVKNHLQRAGSNL